MDALPLLESLRLDIKEGVNELEGVTEPEDGARQTNEESMVYAGVEGSNGLSVSFGGREGATRRLVVEDDARSETVFRSLAW